MLLEWQCVRDGGYVLGIEPSTAHPGGAALNEEHGPHALARARGVAPLPHPGSRWLRGASAVAALEDRIDALHQQLAGEFPDPSGIG